MKPQASFPTLIISLTLLAVLLFMASLLTGPAHIGIKASLAALIGGEQEMLTLIMREIRLPRAILGLLIGAALGMSGAVLQGFLRNPLAEPGIIGTSGTAALGAVLAIQTGLSASFPFALPLAALIGALISVALIFVLAGPRGGTLALILAGIAISALAGAATSLVLNLAPNPFAANEIVFWMMGSLADRSMQHVMIAAPFMLLGFALLWPARHSLDALTLGEDVAATTGISLGRLRLQLITGIAALVGAATAVAGTVGFVGLVVPHLLRPAVGASPSRLVPTSALAGASVVLAADIAVRVLAPDRDLKLGVLTAIIGAPFFLHLIVKTRRQGL